MICMEVISIWFFNLCNWSYYFQLLCSCSWNILRPCVRCWKKITTRWSKFMNIFIFMEDYFEVARRGVLVTIVGNGHSFFYLVKHLIIIIIMSYRQHWSSWSSFAFRLYRPSLPIGLQGYILYRHWAVEYRFMCRSPQNYVAYEFVLVSPVLSCMSRSSNLDSFRDGS